MCFQNRFMPDVSPEIQNWTLMTSRVQLRQIMSNLNFPESILQPYIVRRSEASLQSVVNRNDVGDTNIHNNSTTSQVEVMYDYTKNVSLQVFFFFEVFKYVMCI